MITKNYIFLEKRSQRGHQYKKNFDDFDKHVYLIFLTLISWKNSLLKIEDEK